MGALCSGMGSVVVYYSEVTQVPHTWPDVPFTHIEVVEHGMELPRRKVLGVLRSMYPGRRFCVPTLWTESGKEWYAEPIPWIDVTARVIARSGRHLHVLGVKTATVPCRIQFRQPQLNPRLPEVVTVTLPEGFAESTRFLEKWVNARYQSGSDTLGFEVLSNTRFRDNPRDVKVGTLV